MEKQSSNQIIKTEPTVMALALSKELPGCTVAIIDSLTSIKPERSLPAVASKLDDLVISRAGGGSQLSKLKKEIGEDTTKVLISCLLFDLADFYNVKGGLSDNQAAMMVEVIMAEFWYLKIEQITRAFYLQKMGKLLKIYDRLDPATVIEILNKYTSSNEWVYERDALEYKEQYDSIRSSQPIGIAQYSNIPAFKQKGQQNDGL